MRKIMCVCAGSTAQSERASARSKGQQAAITRARTKSRARGAERSRSNKTAARFFRPVNSPRMWGGGFAPARERAAKSPLGAPGIRLSAISTAACWAAGNGGFDFPDAGIAVVFWGVGSMFANIALAFGHGANKSCAGQEKCVREKRELQSAQNNNPKRTEKCLLENGHCQCNYPPPFSARQSG